MATTAPPVDARTAVDIARQVRALLAIYAPAWREQYTDPATGQVQTDHLGTALIEIFSRFAEIILQRLNQVPEKNLLAFLDLLGESRLPPQPARAPLSFSLAPGSTVDAIVPAGTQVAAPPAEGEKEPIIFETERELVVTAAQLVFLFIREPAWDRYADHSDWLIAPVADIPVFQGDRPIEHSLYLGHDTLLAYSTIHQLHLEVDLETDLTEPVPREVRWEIWDGDRGQPLIPVNDSTAALTKTGIVEFAFDGSSRAPFPVIPEQTVDSQLGHWLRCRLSTPIVPNLQLPVLTQVRLGITLQNDDLAIDSAFTNGVAVELSKDFYPFGEKPKSGDTLFLAQSEVFSKAGAEVTLSVVCANPHYLTAAGRAVAPVNPSGDLQLAWECWDGNRWVELGRSRTPPWVTLIELQPLPETTMNSTVVVEGTVRPGTGVTVTGAHVESTVYIGEDGRLAARVVLPSEQLGIIAFEATFQKRAATAWAIGDRRSKKPPKIVLTRVLPEETDADQIEITGEIAGASQVFVSQGALNQSFEAEYSAPKFTVKVPLAEGHNALLIQADLNGRAVAAMTVAVARRAAPPAEVNGFTDGAWGFCQSGTVSFSLPASLAGTAINGQPGYWVRVRLLSGDYGKEAVYRLKDPTQPAEGYTLTAATFRSPLLASVRVDYIQTRLEKPQYCRSLNDFVYTDVTAVNASGTAPYIPFQPTQDLRPTCYFGFTLPSGRTDFPNRNLSLYLRAAEVKYGATALTAASSAAERPRLVWQYWKGTDWTDLTVQDGSENFTRTGLLEWLAPADFAARTEFGQSRYWLRVRWDSGAYRLPPRLSRLLFNTTPAIQAITVRNEILGSSDGSENQPFRATRAPLLAGQQLQVREPELPSAEEQAVLEQAVGEGAISIVRDAAGRLLEIWVRWQQVSDFYGSRPRDRHYVLDALSGEIRFGNGRNGLIPPIGAGNIRLTYYRTGGGLAGNRPANTIVQLKTTVPYVDKVTNPEPAEGGAEAESLDSLLARAPRTLRHHHRAVSLEDYEDLALLASPAVARAKCVPLYDLITDPDTKNVQPGTVSLIIVPRTTEPKPVPSLELLDQVSYYLDERRTEMADLVIVGPDYVRVDVTVEVALVSLEGASGVQREVAQTLARFLHPLTGGLDQNGWDFGREPYLSDLYALLEAVAGVDHIRSLHKQEIEERPGALATGRFLVYSGTHTIRLTFAET